MISVRRSRSLVFAPYRPLFFLRRADGAFLMTVRGETFASRAAFRKEIPLSRILATAFVTPVDAGRGGLFFATR